MNDRTDTIAYCHACGAPMDVSAVAPFTNVECPKCGKHTRVKREFGPYTLMRRHAMGGMSMVFVAHDNTLDREVALKILSEEYSADEKRIEAFVEEARITASFSHPNVVRVLTTGRAFGRFYIAMEFVPGGHFEHQIRERGKIPETEILPLAIDVAQGLKAAHAAGLIHRDVKPGNILLDAEGHAKLVDFGLALVTHGGKAQATELWATPYYVPPETVESQEEDFRSDIYAFGSTLYHALAGKPPCGEETMATDVLREAKRRIMPLSVAEHSVSADTCRIVAKAMAYRPDDRYASYDQMISELTTALSHVRSGRAETGTDITKRRAERKRGERKWIGGIAASLIAVAALAVFLSKKPKPAAVAKPAPPVQVAPQPVVTDNTAASTEIAKNYREAHAAVDAKDYETAAKEFAALLANDAVQEPTRTWAGIEAILANLLDGRSRDAKQQAALTLDHIHKLPENASHVGANLVATIESLKSLEPSPIPKPDATASAASQVIAANLAGLKNWEQGLLEPAAACFKTVIAVKLSTDDQWAMVYQKLAQDYLSDHQSLNNPLFEKLPTTKPDCATAIDNLNAVLAQLKTRGRAKFNVRAWQLDITRHSSLIGKPMPEVAEHTQEPAMQMAVLPDILAKLKELSQDYRFQEVVSYIKSLPEDVQGTSRTSLLAVAESAVVFLTDIEEDLAKEPVIIDFQLKSGEAMSKLAVNTDGAIIATNAAGETRLCKWSDMPSDTLIAVHRIIVKNPKSEIERLRRHECAISFEWLAGDRDGALAAASVLSQASATFKQHWENIAKGLPK